jgi:hypothetical protein
METTFGHMVFRVMPAYRLPDSVLFQRIGDQNARPSGLAVAALLGSSFATGRLSPKEQSLVKTFWQTYQDAGREDAWRSLHPLYQQYLKVLETLFLPPPREAPAFMNTEGWAVKSCQTSLAGWAQMRHAFTLQAKMYRRYFGLVEVPPGFVEDNPEFFARMSAFIKEARSIFEEKECLAPSSIPLVAELKESAVFIEKSGWDRPGVQPKDFYKQMTASGNWEKYFDILDRYAEGGGTEKAFGKMDSEAFRQFHLKLIDTMRTMAKNYESGALQPSPADNTSQLQKRWLELERISRSLEAMAHKQLRKEKWNEREKRFLTSYGEELAFVMGYFGNSWLTPRDDAPRWAAVAGDPARDALLAAAVGRPRYIYVLYPWNGIEVLCKGAVMQYYEYESRKRLTDEEWKGALDSGKAPAIPDWMTKYASPPAPPSERR